MINNKIIDNDYKYGSGVLINEYINNNNAIIAKIFSDSIIPALKIGGKKFENSVNSLEHFVKNLKNNVYYTMDKENLKNKKQIKFGI